MIKLVSEAVKLGVEGNEALHYQLDSIKHEKENSFIVISFSKICAGLVRRERVFRKNGINLKIPKPLRMLLRARAGRNRNCR